jgi:hypothetical protein
MSRRAAITLVLAGLAAAAPAALGHSLSSGHAHHPGSDALSPSVVAAVALAAALLLRRVSGRHVLALGLAVLLSVTTFEVALHSVHHLDEPDAGASCPVLAATAELHGTSAPRMDVDVPGHPPERLVGLRLTEQLPVPAVRVREGRAPPVSRSA